MAKLLSLLALIFILISVVYGRGTVVIYWGQDGAGLEPPLATVCQNDKVGIVALAFVDVFFQCK